MLVIGSTSTADLAPVLKRFRMNLNPTLSRKGYTAPFASATAKLGNRKSGSDSDAKSRSRIG
jgi:hypothetical protein